MGDADNQERTHNRPGDEGRGFIQVVDGATVQGKSAFDHGGGMQGKGREQEEIIDMVVATKPASPQEHRIDRARAVNRHGEQKEMPVNKPVHSGKG